MPKRISLDDLRIASTCPAGWEQMDGDERVRFCKLCNLHVYNISEMSERQVKTLVGQTEGRICARLYRRVDGTVLTRDCPVGLHALRRRVARAAAAVFASILGFWSVGFGQSSAKKDQACVPQLSIKRTAPPAGGEVLKGVVKDPNGAVIARADVVLTNERTKGKYVLMTTPEGEFSFISVPTGKYTLMITSPGFKQFTRKHLEITPSEPAEAEVVLQVDGEVLMGVLVEGSDDFSNGVRTIRGDVILKLPRP